MSSVAAAIVQHFKHWGTKVFFKWVFIINLFFKTNAYRIY